MNNQNGHYCNGLDGALAAAFFRQAFLINACLKNYVYVIKNSLNVRL